MAQKEPVDEHWQRVHRALLNKIEYRERELAELSEDYLALELRFNGLMGVIRRQAVRDTLERVNRASKAVNDG